MSLMLMQRIENKWFNSSKDCLGHNVIRYFNAKLTTILMHFVEWQSKHHMWLLTRQVIMLDMVRLNVQYLIHPQEANECHSVYRVQKKTCLHNTTGLVTTLVELIEPV